jgi:hypothetical protein
MSTPTIKTATPIALQTMISFKRLCCSTRELRLRTGFLGGRFLAFFAIFHSYTEKFHAPLPRAPGFSHKRQQRHMASAFDRQRQLTLMLGTRPGLSPWTNLATVGQKAPHQVRLLVVDTGNIFITEKTGLAPSGKPPTPSAILILIVILISIS